MTTTDRPTISDTRVEEILDALRAAGDDWATLAASLPEHDVILREDAQHWDLVVTNCDRESGDPAVFCRAVQGPWANEDTGEEGPGGVSWSCTGWSSASQSRIWKGPGGSTRDLVASLRIASKATVAAAMLEQLVAAGDDVDQDSAQRFVAELHDYLHEEE